MKINPKVFVTHILIASGYSSQKLANALYKLVSFSNNT